MMPDDKNLPVAQEVVTSEVATVSDIGTALINLVNRIGPDSTTAMVEALEKMCELQIKMNKLTAQKNFAKAMRGLQSELYSMESLGEMKEGGKVIYKYPTLDQIGRAVNAMVQHLSETDSGIYIPVGISSTDRRYHLTIKSSE